MSDTWSGASSTNWYVTTNWSTGAIPVSSATGTQVVVVNSSAKNQPLISANNAPSTITVAQGGTNYRDAQIAGEQVTLNTGSALTLQGVALGTYLGNGQLGNITGLKAAASATPTFDSHMVLDFNGTGLHTLNVNDVNHNFGEILLGTGATLNVTIAAGGNTQAPHGLYNYGLISISTGADLTLGTVAGGSGTTVGFYNPGWIEVQGGTLDVNSALLDGANTANAAGTPDGFIEIGGGGNVILAGSVASAEQVTFTDTAANTLQITAGTLFSGTVNNFGPSDTIDVNGFTATSNATITNVGGVNELITANGTVITTITLTGTTSTNITTGTNSSGQEYIISGGNTLSGGTTYAGGAHTLTGTNTLANNGTVDVIGSTTDLVVNTSLTGTGAFFIDQGATLALDNAAGNDAGQRVIFGTLGTNAAPNTLIINGNTAGFGGTITGFGVNDDIVLGGSSLPALTGGEGVVLSYSSTTGALTVSETNASGAVVASSAVTVSGTPALTTGSFVALENAKGLNIEIAPTASTSYSFSATGTGAFETASNYTGGTAPGDVISANETVGITAGIASVSSGGVTDNGLISIASGTGFTDAGSLTGTGTLAVLAGGGATLTGTTSLASITDAGTLTLGGKLAGALSLAAGAQATIASNFVDSTALTGTGTLTVNTGITATLAAGSSVASVLDHGTLNLAGAFGGAINMEGNGANTVADFNSANAAATLINFGTSDDIILGTGALAALPAGDGLSLNYATATGVLTISETSATGTVLTTDAVTVAGVASLTSASFVALENAKGLNIELAPTASTTYSFSTTGTGAFETGTNFTGGTAPGDIISGFETVAITAGIASVTSTGVTDNGLITIAKAASFTDAGTLAGTGTLAIAAGGSATLGSATTLGAILDSGTLTVTGASPASPINMEGNGANSVVDFATSIATVPSLYNFGTTDEIIVSGLVIPAGDGLVLSYNTATGVLTGTETSSTGTVLLTDSATITSGAATGLTGNTFTTGSFVDLSSATGTTIELAPTLATSYVFSTTGTGAFETPADFTGGTAPGDVLSSLESVTIAAGTASVSTGGVTDNGTLVVNSSFIDNGSLTGTGTLSIAAGGSATLGGSATQGAILDYGTLTLTGTATDSAINMEGNGASSFVDLTGASNATSLFNFGSTDSIAIGTAALSLSGATDALSVSYNSTTDVVTITDATTGKSVTEHVTLTTGDLASNLHVTEINGSSSARQVELTLCFYPGTALATPEGEIKVEDIQHGTMLLTTNGAMPVRWVGQSHIHTRFADPLRSLPIRIRQGALGQNLPARDLLLSPDHAIHIDGVLIQAAALVNGTSILREHNVPEQFTYFHIELASHELLLAEGVEAESFVDNVDRMHFHNWNARLAPTSMIKEMDLPRAKSARQVPSTIRQRLSTAAVA